jgi:hypothetical protein
MTGAWTLTPNRSDRFWPASCRWPSP